MRRHMHEANQVKTPCWTLHPGNALDKLRSCQPVISTVHQIEQKRSISNLNVLCSKPCSHVWTPKDAQKVLPTYVAYTFKICGPIQSHHFFSCLWCALFF